ncbi:MAG: FAD:protein FMN transferase [Gemmatimonadota bacterium]
MTNPASLEKWRSRLLDLGFERVTGPATTRRKRLGRRAYRVDAERPAMGTRVAVSAIGRSPDRLEEAIGSAFEEMDRLIAVFTRFETDSAISVLNDAGHLEAPPRELARVLARADRFHGLTHGAFDVSVAPLLDLFRDRLGGPSPAAPTGAEIAEVRERVGARHIDLSDRAIRFRRPGMRLTLDGIAKGFIVDGMAAALEARRVRRYLVDGGGDIRTRGRGEGRRPGGGAVATSGSYERFYDGDHRYHHLVDAGSGMSPGEATSVSVVAPTAVDADALATAAFVLGPVAGLAFIDSLAGCACLILDQDGRRLSSRDWKSVPLKPDPVE